MLRVALGEGRGREEEGKEWRTNGERVGDRCWTRAGEQRSRGDRPRGGGGVATAGGWKNAGNAPAFGREDVAS